MTDPQVPGRASALPRIEADAPFGLPPTWAVLERALIDVTDGAMDRVLERYVHPDGSLMWPTTEDFVGVDALDDAYESFFNWPLYYLLGGSERYLESAHREFDAITRQFAHYQTGFGHPMVVNEYEQGYDWFHQSEGYTFFYFLSMADPGNEKTRARALRFAGLYLNEDPSAINWDPELRLVKAPCTGSMGPAQRNFSGAQFTPFRYFEHLTWAGLPFQDVPGVTEPEDLKDDAKAMAMGAAMEARQSRGDVPTNLAITGMMANAYLFTGDAKYRSWIEGYAEAWQERARQNGGIIPDNVGLSGRVGEYLEGKWYGGYYGWTYPCGWESIGSALTCAAENAMLLSGDARFLDLARSQLDRLMEKAIQFEDTVHVPMRFGAEPRHDLGSIFGGLRGDDPGAPLPPDAEGPLLWSHGWFDYAPVNPEFPTHLWYMSMSDVDRERLATIRNHRRPDWQTVGNPVSWRPTVRKNQAGHEHPWVSFLAGEFPDYPEEILRYDLAQVYRRLAFIRDDVQDPATYGDFYLQERNPVTVEALVQLTLGAPMPIYNGGLLMARIRYFDRQKRRPGLPSDVAALVRHVADDRLIVHLVNLSTTERREVVLQAGAFGEHQFAMVRYTSLSDDAGAVSQHFDPSSEQGTQVRSLPVDSRWLVVALGPGCETTVDAEMRGFVNRPSHEEPW